jgi:hypothetical protein
LKKGFSWRKLFGEREIGWRCHFKRRETAKQIKENADGEDDRC